MVYNISILLTASANYLEISNTLLEYSENALNIFTSSFQKFLDNVSAMPFMYPQFNRKPKYRKAPLAYSYMAYYCVNNKEKTVEIHQILSTKQDSSNIF